MALALRCDEFVRAGQVKSFAELARLGHVSRARLSQIMSLLQLAPDLQEELLFRSRPQRGRDPWHLRLLLPITAVLCWREQRRRCDNCRRGDFASNGARHSHLLVVNLFVDAGPPWAEC